MKIACFSESLSFFNWYDIKWQVNNFKNPRWKKTYKYNYSSCHISRHTKLKCANIRNFDNYNTFIDLRFQLVFEKLKVLRLFAITD